MEYQERLNRYKQLKDNLPNNNLVQVCVDRYEINLTKYRETSEEKYILILNAIGNILDQFLDIEFSSNVLHSHTFIIYSYIFKSCFIK